MSTLTAMPPMAKKNGESEYCDYASVKVDRAILARVRAAAALSDDATIAEYMSDALNEATAKKLNLPPIKRKPPKPRA